MYPRSNGSSTIPGMGRDGKSRAIRPGGPGASSPGSYINTFGYAKPSGTAGQNEAAQYLKENNPSLASDPNIKDVPSSVFAAGAKPLGEKIRQLAVAEELRAEAHKLSQQLVQEERLRIKAEAQVEELRSTMKPLSDAIVRLQDRDAQLEALQQQIRMLEEEAAANQPGDSVAELELVELRQQLATYEEILQTERANSEGLASQKDQEIEALLNEHGLVADRLAAHQEETKVLLQDQRDAFLVKKEEEIEALLQEERAQAQELLRRREQDLKELLQKESAEGDEGRAKQLEARLQEEREKGTQMLVEKDLELEACQAEKDRLLEGKEAEIEARLQEEREKGTQMLVEKDLELEACQAEKDRLLEGKEAEIEAYRAEKELILAEKDSEIQALVTAQKGKEQQDREADEDTKQVMEDQASTKTQMQAEIDRMSQELEEQLQRSAEQAVQIEEQAAEIGIKIKEIDELEVEVLEQRNSAQGCAEELQQQLGFVKVELATVKEEANHRLQQEELAAKQQADAMNQQASEVAGVRQMLEEARKLEMEQEAKADALAAKVQELVAEKLRVEDELKAVLSSAGAEAEDLAEERRRATDFEQSLMEECRRANDFEQSLAEERRRATDFEQGLVEERRRATDFEKSLAEAQKAASSYSSQAEQLTAQVGQLRSEKLTLEEYAEAFAREVERLKAVQADREKNAQTLAEENEEKKRALAEEVGSRQREVAAMTAEVSELRAEAAPRGQLEADLEEAGSSLQAVRAQLLATMGRLDEEQAERIRQGARAETLEAQLAGERRLRSEQEALAKSKVATGSFASLVIRAAEAQRRQALFTASREASTLSRSKFDERQSVFQARMEEVESQAAEAGDARAEAELALSAVKSEVATLQDEKAQLSKKLSSAEVDGARRLAEFGAETARLEREVQTASADDARVKRATKDLETCDKENEVLRLHNRELSITMQQFKQENEQLVIDNRSLLESVALFEGDLEKVSDRHAQLIGHVNKKQKIRYTVKLKEECAQLRLDLSKARHRLMQLEGVRRCDSLFGALSSLGYAPTVIEHEVKSSAAKGRPSGQEPSSSPAASPQPKLGALHTAGGARSSLVPSPLRAVADGRTSRISPRILVGGAPAVVRGASAAQAQATEEALLRCRIQERALERVNSDFQHLVSLVECAVVGETITCQLTTDDGKPSAQEANFAHLLKSLRSVIASQRVRSGKAVGPAPSLRAEGDAPSTPRDRRADLPADREVASPLNLGKRDFDLDDQSDEEDKENLGSQLEGNQEITDTLFPLKQDSLPGSRRSSGARLEAF